MCVSQSTVCEKIMELLGQNEVDHRQRKLVILSQDRFYKVLTAEQKAKALKGQYASERRGILWRWRGPSGLRWVWRNREIEKAESSSVRVAK